MMKFIYDKFYDNLFNNSDFIDILCKFYSENWYKLGEKERVGISKEFVKKYCEILKIPQIELDLMEDKTSVGQYCDMLFSIDISRKTMKNSSPYEVMDTLFHELRHNFQQRAIAGNLTEFESIDNKTLAKFKLNYLTSPSGKVNYVCNDKFDVYRAQAVEDDAFKTGLACTRKAHEIIRKNFSKEVDPAFIDYCDVNEENIIFFYSDNDKKKAALLELSKMYKENSITYAKERKYCQKVKEILAKEPDEMETCELQVLFSKYVWNHIDLNKKVAILQEYAKRTTNSYKIINIEKISNSFIKIDDRTFEEKERCSILNRIFSIDYQEYVDAILNGECLCDRELREKLAINLYKSNGKKINYIDENINQTLYNIQPFSVFEGTIIKKKFVDIKEQIKTFYGHDEGEFDEYIDAYDYEKFIPFIEKFYEKKFEEIQSDLIKKMEERIKRDKAKKNKLKRK